MSHQRLALHLAERACGPICRRAFGRSPRWRGRRSLLRFVNHGEARITLAKVSVGLLEAFVQPASFTLLANLLQPAIDRFEYRLGLRNLSVPGAV